MVTTLAGTGRENFADGAANAADFRFPMGVCVDPNRRVLVADQKNFCVRQIVDGACARVRARLRPQLL